MNFCVGHENNDADKEKTWRRVVARAGITLSFLKDVEDKDLKKLEEAAAGYRNYVEKNWKTTDVLRLYELCERLADLQPKERTKKFKEHIRQRKNSPPRGSDLWGVMVKVSNENVISYLEKLAEQPAEFF